MPSQKKILVVAESIDVEDSSGTKANVALIINLQDAGFEVLVYHYTRKEIKLPEINCVAIKERKFHPLYLLSRVQRRIQNGFRINLAKHLEPIFGFSFTFFNDTASIARGVKQIKDFNPDLVLTLSKGASFRPHYALLQVPELHKKWMAYIHDPYPFHNYPAPYNWSEPGYQQKVQFFKEVACKCRWAAFPSLLLAEWMGKFHPAFKEKFVVIPHQKNVEIPQVELPVYFDAEKLNFLHAGTLLPERNPFPLVAAFEQFLSKKPKAKKDVRLILVGNISDEHKALQKEQKKTPQILSSDYLAFNIVQKMQYLSSVNIILESVAEVSPFLPGKFPHCVAANKPILHLGPKESEVRRLLGADYEYCAEADDVDKISLILETLYIKWKADPHSLKLEREDLQSYLSTKYLEKQINNLI